MLPKSPFFCGLGVERVIFAPTNSAYVKLMHLSQVDRAMHLKLVKIRRI
jgi:hypothetical protein